MTKAASLHLACTSSSYQPKMLQVWTLQDKAHKSNMCMWLPQVSPGSFKAKLQQLAKCNRCCKHFKRWFSSFLFCFPRNKHPISVVRDQRVHQSKKSEFYMHTEGLLLNPVFPNVYRPESHLSARRAHVFTTRESANIINLVSKTKTLKHA